MPRHVSPFKAPKRLFDSIGTNSDDFGMDDEPRKSYDSKKQEDKEDRGWNWIRLIRQARLFLFSK